MSRFLSEKLCGFDAYTPGEQPQDRKYIKLNTNESPFPPSPQVIEAVNGQEVSSLRLYSDPESKLLKTELAKTYGVEENQIFVANGSDEALNFAFMAYGDRGAYFPDITYGFYSVFCDLYGIPANIIPLEEDFTVDVTKYYGKNALIVIANPNAPTGIVLPLESIRAVIEANRDGVVVVDEAYVDFGAQSAVGLINDYPNLLVVQTFSKSRSLAGARLGFAIGQKDLIADLEKIKYATNPYNVNRLTGVTGVAALRSDEYFKTNAQRIMMIRENTAEELRKMGFLLTDSSANFLFAKHPDYSGKELYLKLKDAGILIRHFEKDRIRDYNRITVGNEEEMQALLTALKNIIGGNI